MMAREAYCERVGSVMKSCYNVHADPDPMTLMDKVLLREASVRCICGARDTEVCRAVAEVMADMGRTPFRSSRQNRKVASTLPGAMKVALAQQLLKLCRTGRMIALEDPPKEDEEQVLSTESESEDIALSLDAAVSLSSATLSTRDLRSWRIGRVAETQAAMEMTSRMTNALDEDAVRGSSPAGVEFVKGHTSLL